MTVFVENPDWKDHIKAESQRILHKVVDDVRDDAKIIAPVDTGLLKQSIGSEYVSEILGIVRANVHYAPYVEEGHRVAYRGADGQTHFTGDVVPPQPFMRPALYKQRDLT